MRQYHFLSRCCLIAVTIAPRYKNRATRYKLFIPHQTEPYSRIPPTADPLKLDAIGWAVSPYRLSDSEKIMPAKNSGSERTLGPMIPLTRGAYPDKVLS